MIEKQKIIADSSACIAASTLLPAATGVKGYSLFEKELFDWYRKNKPNSGLPSKIVVGILYDDYLKAL